MTQLEALWKGLLAGIAIAAPVGPVNVLCLRRTLSKGWKSGLVSGFGAAAADAAYGGIAAFSVRIVIAFLRSQETPIKLIGGLLLIGLGIRYWFRPASSTNGEDGSSGRTDFASAFLLNLANPTTILSFLAVLAALGTAARSDRPVTALVVAGIFLGSMAWWVLLAVAAERLRDRFDEAGMRWMNRVAALAIGAFGVFTFVSGWLKSRG
ncbi:MAG: LysE family transporter [Bryobacteraceae bacterium]|jgi:threonine/homoserine/homoserine lactone efflux protein